MSPTVCIYCGINFMKKFDEDKVCNNCCRRFTPTNVRVTSVKRTVKAQIEIPEDLYKKIEEYCINEGISLSTYFLGLFHYYTVEEDTIFLPKIEKNITTNPIARSLKTKRKREKNIDN